MRRVRVVVCWHGWCEMRVSGAAQRRHELVVVVPCAVLAAAARAERRVNERMAALCVRMLLADTSTPPLPPAAPAALRGKTQSLLRTLRLLDCLVRLTMRCVCVCVRGCVHIQPA